MARELFPYQKQLLEHVGKGAGYAAIVPRRMGSTTALQMFYGANSSKVHYYICNSQRACSESKQLLARMFPSVHPDFCTIEMLQKTRGLFISDDKFVIWDDVDEPILCAALTYISLHSFTLISGQFSSQMFSHLSFGRMGTLRIQLRGRRASLTTDDYLLEQSVEENLSFPCRMGENVVSIVERETAAFSDRCIIDSVWDRCFIAEPWFLNPEEFTQFLCEYVKINQE